jgi:alkylation response protein AidB-like acyl-CoA dehydrogenase
MSRTIPAPPRSRDAVINPVEQARRVAAVAARYADESERARRLAAPVVDALVSSGLARLIAPTALGGAAAHPAVLVEVVETIAAADASAGWCAGIGLGSNYFAGLLPESGARALFVDLDRTGSGVFAPTGTGVRTGAGFQLTGRWSFASGCCHAAVQASGMVAVDPHGQPERNEDGSPVVRLAFVPIDAVSIDETWDTVGLRGTGSHDTAIVDRLVPEDHTLRFTDRSWSDDLIYQHAPFAVLGPFLGAVALGAGRAALDVLESEIRVATTTPRPGRKPAFGEDPISQAELAHAEVRLRSVRALLLDTLDDGYQTCASGRRPDRAHAALVGLACREAVAAAVHAIDVAARLSGSRSVREGSRLDRLGRDVQTMRQHVMFSPALAAQLGRQLAGLPTVAFPFLLPSEPTAA